jgi:hypothetical protein
MTEKRLTRLDMRIEMVHGERGTRRAHKGCNELGLGRHQGRAVGRKLSAATSDLACVALFTLRLNSYNDQH